MKNRKVRKAVLAGCLGVFLAAAPAGALKAAGTAEYTVTLRPGSIAKFSQAFVDAYKEAKAQGKYGVKQVDVTSKTGSIKVKLEAGAKIPYLPDNGDLIYEGRANGRYTMDTDWYPKDLTVTGNESFVVKYEALKNAVEYRVRYVDSESGEDVRTPVIAQGNVGETYTYYSEAVENYVCSTERGSVTLTEDIAENEIVFRYTSTLEPQVNVVETPGDTITQTQTIPGNTTVVTQPGAAGGGAAAGTTAGTGAGGAGTAAEPGTTPGGGTGTEPGTEPEGGTTIEENDTPRAETPETDDKKTEEIEENDTPKGNKKTGGEAKEKSSLPYAAAGAAVVLIGGGALALYIRRKR